MKMHTMKAGVLGLVVMLMLVLVSSVSFAADCKSATIMKIGFDPRYATGSTSGAVVQLDCLNDAIWSGTVQFYLSSDMGDQGLATLLTAYSLGNTIWARVGGTTSGSILTIGYLNKP